MTGIAKRSARQRFHHGIITTFGKLDTLDIEQLDGSSAQLVGLVMTRYGWSSAEAQHKVEQFMTRMTNGSL
jgi:hypothetical protein